MVHSISSVNICELKNDSWNWKKLRWFKRTSFETDNRISLCDIITELTDVCTLVILTMLSYKDRGPKYSLKLIFDLMGRTLLPYSAKFTFQQSEDQSDSHCKKIYFCSVT